MRTVFPEFENENQLRRYPFAANSVFADTDGAEIDTTDFLDASIYLSNPAGVPRLTAIDYDAQTIEVSDDNGLRATGVLGRNIKLYDTSTGSPCGSIVASVGFRGSSRREFTELYFAAGCIIPVNPPGVTGIRIGDQILTGDIVFTSGSHITPRLSVSGGEATLSFKVTPSTVTSGVSGIRKVYFYEAVGSLFSISPYEWDGDKTYSVQMHLRGITRDDICNAAHREDLLDIYDTCREEKCICAYNGTIHPSEESVFLELDLAENGANAFSVVAPNPSEGVYNPLNVQLVDGTGSVASLSFDPDMSQDAAENELRKLYSLDATTHSVKIQIPGLEVK